MRPQDQIVPRGTPLTLKQLDQLAADCIIGDEHDYLAHRKIILRLERAQPAEHATSTLRCAAVNDHFTRWCRAMIAGDMGEAGAQRNALTALLLIADDDAQLSLENHEDTKDEDEIGHGAEVPAVSRLHLQCCECVSHHTLTAKDSAEMRAKVRELGWRICENGEADLCPNCVAALVGEAVPA